MRRLWLSVLVLAAVALMGAALAGSNPAAGQPMPATPTRTPGTIHVTGQGIVTATPDVAVLTIGASVLRDTPDDAFQHASELVTALTDVLTANGVADKDIRTREISLLQESQPPICPPQPQPAPGQPAPTPVPCQPQPPKWRARHFLTVKIRDFSKIGTILGAGVAALEDSGVVQGISFTIENTDPLAQQARAAAADAALAKARTLADHLGVRLGDPISVNETSSPAPTPLQPVARPTAVPIAPPVPGSAPAIAVPVAPGEITITVTVDVVFAIDEGQT